MFQMRLRDAPGPLARAAVWAGAFPEVLMNAAAVHWDILKQDLRYTARTLGRAPGFALTAIAIVALGVGANTAAFSVTDFVLIRPLPFQDPDRLVTIWQRSPGYSRMELSPPNIQDWKAAARSFERVGIHKAAWRQPDWQRRTDPDRGRRDQRRPVPDPRRGGCGRAHLRRPAKTRARAPRTVILSDRLWRSAFGGDPAILGRTILLDADTYSVIGVMPPGFAFPRSRGRPLDAARLHRARPRGSHEQRDLRGRQAEARRDAGRGPRRNGPDRRADPAAVPERERATPGPRCSLCATICRRSRG